MSRRRKTDTLATSRRGTLRFIDSTVILVVTQSFSLVIGFVVSVIVSRTLGPEGKGVFSLLLGLGTILFGISNLGLGYASQYFISRNPETARTHFANVLFFPLAAAVLVIGGFYVGFPSWRSQHDGIQWTELIPVVVMLPLMLVFEGCCQLLVALNQIVLRGIAAFFQSGVALLAAIALILAGASAAE